MGVGEGRRRNGFYDGTGMTTPSSDDATLQDATLLRLSAEIAAAYLANSRALPSEVPEIVKSVRQALGQLGQPAPAPPVERPKPAVPIGRSVQQDYIVCLEDGKKLKMLKRYLTSHYGLTPEEYRRRWGLAPDYPMVAPSYATRRSEFARQIGLGRGVRGQSRAARTAAGT
jgi:predicted transcriptional regulator